MPPIHPISASAVILRETYQYSPNSLHFALAQVKQQEKCTLLRLIHFAKIKFQLSTLVGVAEGQIQSLFLTRTALVLHWENNQNNNSSPTQPSLHIHNPLACISSTFSIPPRDMYVLKRNPNRRRVWGSCQFPKNPMMQFQQKEKKKLAQ